MRRYLGHWLGACFLVVLTAPPCRAQLQTRIRDAELPRLQVVLRGALYRSGTPSETGLTQMCQEGWKRAYSLYGDRTSQFGPRNAPMAERGFDQRQCTIKDGKGGRPRTFEWRSAFSGRQRSLPHIFQDIVDTVRNPAQGPVLVHCWNGLHYAGMVGAMALRQFCGFSADEAETYWRANTRNADNYPRVIQHLREFQRYAGFNLTPAERKRICPGPNALLAWSAALKDRAAREPESAAQKSARSSVQ